MSSRKLKATRVRLQKILRKNRYGLALLEDEYYEALRDIYNDEYIQALTADILSEQQQNFETEALSDDFYVNLQTKLNGIILKIASILERAWDRGTEKVMDITSATLVLNKPQYKIALQLLLQSQFEYIKNIDAYTREVIRNEIKNGLIFGKTYDQMAKMISNRASELTEQRARLIAQTELVRTTAEAQEQTLKANNIDKYIYLSAEDNRVSEICWHNSKTNGKKTDPYKVYAVGNGPLPVRDSHPRCRCVIVKAPDE